MTEQKIFFITDSACDIPPQEEAQLDNLCILPIPVTADGEGYYERESFTAEEFYDLIERCKEIPVTSHIPSITFQERYEQAWEKGYTHLVVLTIYSGASSMYHSALMARDAFLEEHPGAMTIEVIEQAWEKGYTHLVVLTIYSGASSMYHSALMARDAFLEEHPGAMTIEVIDSNCYTVGYGYPLMQACKKAQQGAEFEQVVAYIRDYLDRVRIYFSPFTLQYVKKSGRVSCTAAFVGELIGLRPVKVVAYIRDYLDRVRIYFSPFTLQYVKKSGRVSCTAAFVGELIGLRPVISAVGTTSSAVGTTSVVEKVRGNAAILSSMEKMFAAQRSKKQENAPYMILVARDTPASQELAQACEKIAGYPPVGIYKIGAAITINTGPQIIGLTFLAD